LDQRIEGNHAVNAVILNYECPLAPAIGHTQGAKVCLGIDSGIICRHRITWRRRSHADCTVPGGPLYGLRSFFSVAKRLRNHSSQSILPNLQWWATSGGDWRLQQVSSGNCASYRRRIQTPKMRKQVVFAVTIRLVTYINAVGEDEW